MNTRKLFVWAAALTAVSVFAGFARAYYLRHWFGMPDLSLFLHLHGLAMTSWVVLFLIQTMLISARRVSLHRKLGILGIASASLVVAFGTAATIMAARREVLAQAKDVPNVITVLALELTQMLMFASFVGGGLLLRNRPDYHKRLMLLATFCMLPNAIVRITVPWSSRILPPVPWANFILPLILWSLSIGLVCAIDSAVNRRLHPAFGRWTFAPVLLLWLAYFVGASNAWQHFARGAVRYGA